MNRIVIFDPTGKYEEGRLVGGDKSIALLHGRGGVTLPVEPNLLGRNAVAGYFMRKWGGGATFDRMIGARACPMLLYAVPDYGTIYWAFRIMPIDGAVESHGSFKLAMHSGQVGTITGGLSADGVAHEVTDRTIDKHGGWTVIGTSKLNCSMEGYLGLSVYGVGIGVRVMWSAATQAR